MNRTAQHVSLLLTGMLALPSWISPALALTAGPDLQPGESAGLVAKKGGGGGGGGSRIGGGGGGGGARIGGGGSRIGSGGGGGHSGFKNAGPGLSSGSNKPSGGWSSKSKSSSGPSLERPKASQSHTSGSLAKKGDRDRDNRTDVRKDRIDQRGDVRTTRIENRTDRVHDRSKVRRDRVDNRGRNYWDTYPGWARPGWGPARPWNTGWYGGWSSPSWGWWGPRAAAWGVASLTTAAVINAAVNDAVNDHVSYITVPNSNYDLMYGTVAPSGSDVVSFDVFTGETAITMRADCRRGTLNGSTPNSAGEAELLNAACQVAYGNV